MAIFIQHETIFHNCKCRWALGALLFEMLSGNPPFTAKTQKELDRKILSEKFVSPPYLNPHTHAILKGLLEKDVTKRLGSTKSTMFSIGGVSALKQHQFFADIDWNALLRKEIRPPIDLSIQTDDETTHFHEGFTGQQVSHSMIEDILSSATSPSRSRAGSGDATNLRDEFADFDYIDSSFVYSDERMQAVEAELAIRMSKLQKKRQFKEKQDAEKLAKALEQVVTFMIKPCADVALMSFPLLLLLLLFLT